MPFPEAAYESPNYREGKEIGSRVGTHRRRKEMGEAGVDSHGAQGMFLFRQNVTSGNWRIKGQNPLSETVWAGITWMGGWVSVELH